MDQNQTQTWSVSRYGKAKYQISNEYLKAWRKKVRKTENLWYFSKFNGHNSVKNGWIKTKLELDLYLSMTKQCTKYQMNIWKHEQKKCGKLIYRTDGQTERQTDGRTECKPKVPSDFVGRGLIKKSNVACVQRWNISQYDSGERCGPWASCYKSYTPWGILQFSGLFFSLLTDIHLIFGTLLCHTKI